MEDHGRVKNKTYAKLAKGRREPVVMQQSKFVSTIKPLLTYRVHEIGLFGLVCQCPFERGGASPLFSGVEIGKTGTSTGSGEILRCGYEVLVGPL